jgi:hypothetical protein
MVEPRELAAGPISPELVLVDPELAARARSALPEHPWPAPVPIEPSPRPGRDERAPLAAIFGIVSFVAALLLVILVLSVIPRDDRPTFAANDDGAEPAPPPTTAQSPQPVAPRRTQPPAARKKPAAKRTEPARRPRTRSKPARRPGTVTQPRRRSTPRKRREQPRFTPARTFSWPPQARAASYQVTFLRNGKAFYRTRTRAPRVELPRRVRFTSGGYRWIVRPVIAGALGDPIVDSTFEVGRD